MSWRAPRPLSKVAAAPPKRMSGDSAICAFLTAVTVFVTPGPAVTTATPGIPESLAVASAAKTAVTSCLVSTTRMPIFSDAVSIGAMCPPDKVKMFSTP